MSRIFAPLDDALIERLFQPVSDFFSYRFGVGHSGAACLSLDVASVGWILARARGLSSAVMAWDAGASFVRLVVLLLGLMALISLRIAFRRTEGKRQANPLRLSMRPHRAVVLVMLTARVMQWALAPHSVAGLGDMADVAMVLFATVALYLGACAESPPVKRGWLAMVGVGAR
jgi:hypothetical protein